MATVVTMPVLGLTMEEGTVAGWLKQPGDTVERDEPLLLVEMDKGTIEVPSPSSGVLARILVNMGETVPVRTPIAEIYDGTPDAPVYVASTTAVAQPSAAVAAALTPASQPVTVPVRRHFASPRARLRARQYGVDLTALTGSGPNGRVVEEDVLHSLAPAAESAGRFVATPLARRLAREHGIALESVRGSGPGGRITESDVLAAAPPSLPEPVAANGREALQPLSRLRRLTAERMAASVRSVARVTLHLDADLTEAVRFREQLQPEFARLGVTRLPWDAIFARAAGLTLADFPALLGEWVEGEGIAQHGSAHVGVAVALGDNGSDGLVVPVLRNAESRSLRELAADLLRLVERAQANRLAPSDLESGTFAITNLGRFRVDGFSPIVIPGQTAILGVGRIAERPAVVGGQLAVRTLCTLSLSFDHRVVDGAPAAAFLARLAELLERPYALLGI